MQSHQAIIDLYRQGRELNLRSPFRQGQLLQFTVPGQIIMTGDLHGHERNFDKIIRFANLPDNPHRHLILHELLHESEIPQDGCTSFRLLERALRLQKIFPQQVHFLLGNHGLCQIFERPVAHACGDAVEFLQKGLTKAYGPRAEEVCQAMCQFLSSEPLAARLPNRIFLSHSLPPPAKMSQFDPRVIDKESLEQADFDRDGSVYLLLWGRRQQPDQLAKLGRAWGVDLFITGHQPQEMGFSQPNPQQIILASDNNHGCCLPIDMNCTYTAESLAAKIVRLAGVM